jgi:ketosteroid isomerase-like protein
MFTGSFEDRLLIRERYGAYSDAVFRRDVEAWLTNWTEDCVWAVFATEHRGRSALRAQWDAVWSSLSSMAFFAEIGAIEVDGDRAAARCYTREILCPKAGGVPKVVGAYADELVRENGVWLFSRRSYSVLIDETNRRT